jgi:hypothetical protein
MTDKCRICRRVAVANLDKAAGKLPFCELHRDFMVKVLEESALLESDKRLIGFGFNLEAPDAEGYAPLRCDKSTVTEPHSWTGVAGDVCHFCLVSYSLGAEYQRDILLEDIDLDRDDLRYDAAVERKTEALKRGVKVALINKEEALLYFDKWVSSHD